MKKSDVNIFVKTLGIDIIHICNNKTNDEVCMEHIKKQYIEFVKNNAADDDLRKLINTIYSDIRRNKAHLGMFVNHISEICTKNNSAKKQEIIDKNKKQKDKEIGKSITKGDFIYKQTDRFLDEVIIIANYKEIYRGDVKVMQLSKREHITIRLSPFNIDKSDIVASSTGNYYLIKIAPQNDNVWSLDENKNLVCQVPVHLYDALLGTVIMVTLLDDTVIKVDIPPLTKDGQQIIIPDKGWPMSNEKRSNLIVKACIIYPDYLSEYEKQIINTLRNIEKSKTA